MAQAGFTPISLYFSTTAAAVPTSGNLVAGELALNTVDEKLYFKNSAGTVKLLASNATSAPVLSFQTSLGGLTPSTATAGVVTLAGTLNTSSGGTGLTTFTAGDVPYYAAGTLLSKLAIGTAGQILTSTGTAPQWSTLSGVAVTTFSAGTTGFTPSSATSGAVTLAGTLGTANGGTNLTSFTSGGVVYASSSSALATGSALVFDGTNLGVGVTPQAWNSDYKAFNYGSAGLIYGRTSSQEVAFGTNWYRNSAGSFLYSTTGFASYYAQALGVHVWYQAASGTAGNAVTFTQAMTLDASGQLAIGATGPILTSTYTGKLSVYTAGGANVVAGGGSNTTNTVMSRIVGVNQFNGNSGNDAAAEFQGITSIETALITSNSNVSGDSGGYLVFKTKAQASALTERVRIDSAGTFILKNDYQEQTFTANSSTAITLNIVTNGTDQVITLTGTATITMPTATAGKSFLLKLKTGAGGYTVTWATVKWPGGTAPTLTSTASRMDIFSFFSDGTNWYGCTVGQNYTP
jgi:hypothetical protein